MGPDRALTNLTLDLLYRQALSLELSFGGPDNEARRKFEQLGYFSTALSPVLRYFIIKKFIPQPR